MTKNEITLQERYNKLLAKYLGIKGRIFEIGCGIAKEVDYSKPRQIADYIYPGIVEEVEFEDCRQRIRKIVEKYAPEEAVYTDELLKFLEQLKKED